MLCKKNNPDLRFLWNNEEWFVEAKISSNDDRCNAVHKLFGELLKMTGIKTKNPHKKIGLLIDNKNFFASHFKYIDERIFEKFGEIVPVEKIFVFENGGIDVFNWNDILR